MSSIGLLFALVVVPGVYLIKQPGRETSYLRLARNYRRTERMHRTQCRCHGRDVPRSQIAASRTIWGSRRNQPDFELLIEMFMPRTATVLQLRNVALAL